MCLVQLAGKFGITRDEQGKKPCSKQAGYKDQRYCEVGM